MTTQRGVKKLTESFGRRFCTRQQQLQSPLLITKFYTETVFSSTPSALGNTCAQLFVTSEGHSKWDVIKNKSERYRALDKLCREDIIPA